MKTKIAFFKDVIKVKAYSQHLLSTVLLFLLFGLSVNTVLAQDQQDLRELTDAYTPGKCPANDIRIISATISTGSPCFTCTGGSITVPLTIRINHNTESQDRFLAICGTLIETLPGGGTVETDISECFGPLLTNSEQIGGGQDLAAFNITFTCGSTLQLTDILLVWTAANGECPVTLANNPNGKYCWNNPVVDIPTGIMATAVPTNAACFGSSTGSIALTVSGGAPPYTYAWTATTGGPIPAGQADDEDLVNIPAGTYSVVITDSRNCTKTVSGIAVGQNPLATPDITKAPASATTQCGVSATAAQAAINTAFAAWLAVPPVVTGGTPPYGAVVQNPLTPTAPLYTGGSTSVTWSVTDACGRTDSVTAAFTVSNPCRIICETLPSPVLCYGGSTGSIRVRGSNGFSPYSFYLYLSSDTQFANQLASFPNVNPIAPNSYAEATFTGLAAGTYTILITDGAQNLANATVCANTTVSQPPALTCSISPSVNPSCNGGTNGSLTAVGAGGTPPYMYSLNGGAYQSSGTFSGLSANVLYTVTTKDANNCTSTCTKTLTQPAVLTCSISPFVNPSCYGGTNGSITAVGSGGTAPYMYSLNGGAYQSSGTFSGLSANVLYTVTTKDANNCTSTCTKTLTQPTAVSCSIDQSVNPTCNGGNNGSLTAVGSGGTPPYMYSLNGGAYQSSGTFSGLSGGVLYTVTTKDANNCTSTCTKTLTAPSTVSCSIVPDNLECYGASNGALTASGSGGTAPYMYSLNGGAYQSSGTFSGLSGGVLYTVTVKDANNCTSVCTVTLTQPPLATPDITKAPASATTLCGVSAAAAQAAINTAFAAWLAVPPVVTGGTPPYGAIVMTPTNPTAPSYTGAGSGTSVTWSVTDACGRTDSVTAVFTVNNPCRILCETLPTPVLCYGASTGSIRVRGSNGVTPYSFYLYLSSDTLFANLLASFTNVNPVAPNTYAEATFTGLAAGTYTILITDAVQNLANATVCANTTVTQPASAVSCIISESHNPACDGGSDGSLTAVGSGGTAPYMYSLNGGAYQSSGTFSGLSANVLYTVTTKDANNCTSTCAITLEAEACPGKACTPGYWKTHPEVWDSQNDWTVANMPGVLTSPVTPGGTFVTSTNFFTYFNIPFAGNTISTNPNLTMLQAAGTGGGNCQALARHGVAALLGAAAFPGEYPYPAGTNSFLSLYNYIRDAFISGNCEAAHQVLAGINEQFTGEHCGALKFQSPVSLQNEQAPVESQMFTAYPMPFRDHINIRYEFDYQSKARIEVYDSKGIFVMAYDDANAYFNKEVRLEVKFNQGEGQMFIIKVITDNEVGTKRIISKK